MEAFSTLLQQQKLHHDLQPVIDIHKRETRQLTGCPIWSDTKVGLNYIWDTLYRNEFVKSNRACIRRMRSPGSPSTCGSPSATNLVSMPSSMPCSTSTSRWCSSLANFTLGHSSHTCKSIQLTLTVLCQNHRQSLGVVQLDFTPGIEVFCVLF